MFILFIMWLFVMAVSIAIAYYKMIKIFYISVAECKYIATNYDGEIIWDTHDNVWSGRIVKTYKHKGKIIGYDVIVK